MTTTKRAELAATCALEAKWARKFRADAEWHAAAGRIRAAQTAVENALVAAKCAIQAHDQLWDEAPEDLTSEETEAFIAAEVAEVDARAAVRALCAARAAR